MHYPYLCYLHPPTLHRTDNAFKCYYHKPGETPMTAHCFAKPHLHTNKLSRVI